MTHKPYCMLHKVLDQQGRLNHLVTHDIRKDLDPNRETVSHTRTRVPTVPSSSLFPSASGSGFGTSTSSSPRPLSAPWVLSQASRYILQSWRHPCLRLLPEAGLQPSEDALLSSVKKGSHIRC